MGEWIVDGNELAGALEELGRRPVVAEVDGMSSAGRQQLGAPRGDIGGRLVPEPELQPIAGGIGQVIPDDLDRPARIPREIAGQTEVEIRPRPLGSLGVRGFADERVCEGERLATSDRRRATGE